MKSYATIFVITLLSLAFFSSTVIAQDEIQYRKEITVNLSNTASAGQLSGVSSPLQKVTRQVDGSPYYHDEWTTGIALLPNNMKSKGVQMMYSTYGNEVFYRENGKLMKLDNRRVEGFALNVDEGWVVFKNGFNPDMKNLDRLTFFRMIHDGKTKLLAHHRTYTRKNPRPAIATGRVSQEFRHRTEYYLQTEDGEFQETHRSKRDVLRKLKKQYRDRVEEYADENDLNFGEEKELAKILAYYDSLIDEGGEGEEEGS